MWSADSKQPLPLATPQACESLTATFGLRSRFAYVSDAWCGLLGSADRPPSASFKGLWVSVHLPVPIAGTRIYSITALSAKSSLKISFISAFV